MISIVPAVTDEDIRGKAYVHCRSWHEAYAGFVPEEYLVALTLEKCEDMAFRWRDNIIVAKDGDRVVGFAGYSDGGTSASRGAVGEIFALYVLSEYYGSGVGKALMDEAMSRLSGRNMVRLEVLAENARAIRFYEKYGFRKSGKSRSVRLGKDLEAIEMVIEKET